MQDRVIIITQGVSRIVNPVVNNFKVVGIIEDSPRKKASKSLLKRVISKLYRLIKGNKSLSYFCQNKRIPYFCLKKTNSDNCREWVLNLDPDIIVVYSMSQLLKKDIYSIPKHGTINLHPSLLPAYSGPNPWFWMYYNNDHKGGVTLHFIDEHEDTGDIIFQEKYDIPLGMKSPEMQELAINQIGIKLICQALSNINSLPRITQNPVSPTKRARNISDAEHRSFIDWPNWEVERVWHFLRGTESWLNALDQPKGFFSGQRWTVENYHKIKVDITKHPPGNVYRENGIYFVSCRDGVIRLKIEFKIIKLIAKIINKC